MKVLFIGTSGVHHVLVAANLFLSNHNVNHITSSPYFANMQIEEAGTPIYVGTKNGGKDVYVLGVGHEVEMAERTLNNLKNIWGVDNSSFAIIPIYIKGEKIIALVSKLPDFLRFAHLFIVKTIIKRQLESISRQVDIG